MASKERALRREQRLADAAARREAAERREDRRRRLRALRPRLPDRRTGKVFPRRSRTQRAGIAILTVFAVLVVAYLVPSWPARIGLIALILLGMPVFMTLVLDRR
jgi:Flp pilus assembly protein TadB